MSHCCFRTFSLFVCCQVLSKKKIGIVAHFYMDPQVQGVLSSAAQQWPHIHISDSLVMADRAVKMVVAGCTTVAVLGVDFMSENVRAILDEAGHKDTKVHWSSWIYCSSNSTAGVLHVCMGNHAVTTGSLNSSMCLAVLSA